MAKEKEQVKVLVFDLAWPHYFVRCHIKAVEVVSLIRCLFLYIFPTIQVATSDLMIFSAKTAATRTDLIDAIVYGTQDDFDLELLEALAPGQLQVNTENLTGRNYWRH